MNTQYVSPIPLMAQADGQPDQICFVVADIQASMRLWGVDRAGQRQWSLWTYGPELLTQQSCMGEQAPYAMHLALSSHNPQIELIQPLAGPSIYHDWLRQAKSGFHHLGYYVEDLAAVTDAMEAAGYPCVQTGSGHGQDGSGGFAYFDARAELGCYLEAILPPKVRVAPEYVWP